MKLILLAVVLGTLVQGCVRGGVSCQIGQPGCARVHCDASESREECLKNAGLR
jgi:hypothetical protein